MPVKQTVVKRIKEIQMYQHFKPDKLWPNKPSYAV